VKSPLTNKFFSSLFGFSVFFFFWIWPGSKQESPLKTSR